MFEIVIAANPDACRTEAEIADETGERVAIVYEDYNWVAIRKFSTTVQNNPQPISMRSSKTQRKCFPTT